MNDAIPRAIPDMAALEEEALATRRRADDLEYELATWRGDWERRRKQMIEWYGPIVSRLVARCRERLQ